MLQCNVECWQELPLTHSMITGTIPRSHRRFTELCHFSAVLRCEAEKKAMTADWLLLSAAGKYREFHRLYEEGSLEEAASLLVTLMTSQLAPK